MFSLEKINSKLSKGKKKKVGRSTVPSKKKLNSFLSLETSTALFKEDNEQTETQSIPVKKKSNFRYFNYNKLVEDVVDNPADDWGLSHKTPNKYAKSKLLKLNKTQVEVCKSSGKRKKSANKYIKKNVKCSIKQNDNLDDINLTDDKVDKIGNLKATTVVNSNKLSLSQFEVMETLPDSFNKEDFVLRKRKNDVSLRKSDLIKKKPGDNTSNNEDVNCELETEVSNLNLSPDKCIDKGSSAINLEKSKFYLDALIISEDALLVAFLPESEIFFCGNVWVKLLAGSISVFGYKFKEGDLYPVFSPPSHSLMSIKVLEGRNVKQFSLQELKEHDILNDWVQHLQVEETTKLTIIKLCRFENNVSRIIEATKVLNSIYVPNASDHLFKKVLGINVVDLAEEKRSPLQWEPPEWNNCVESLLQVITKDPRIVVAGGKGVGKSTYCKYLINRLLSHSSVDAVACIDIDPGQPEFSLPTVLSLTKIIDPTLGQAFTHSDGMNLCDQTQSLAGDISVTNVLMEYLSIVKNFEKLYAKKYSNIPLLVNTMGYTFGTGFDIMVAVLRIFNPTHVIVINSHKRENNFQCSLAPNFVNRSRNRGIFYTKLFSTSLSYELIHINSVSNYQVPMKNLTLRNLRILSYFSKLWKDEELQLNGLNCKNATKIPWNFVAIHVIDSIIPVEHILEAINASLVALCKIDEEYFEVSQEELPRQIKNGSHWYNTCKCLGWGIVRGIDTVTRDLHILTPLGETEVMLDVNTLVLTKISLPVYFFKLFSGGKGGPYMEKIEEKKFKTK